MSNSESLSNHDAQIPVVKSFFDMPSKITGLLAKESDRGAILILTAYLEELLSMVIRAACVSDLEADKLFEPRGPADDFDAKVRLCRALALIHPNEAKALRSIQRIRNNAAHFDKKGRGFDVLFDSVQTINQVASLAESLNMELDSRECADVRDGFIMLSRLLVIRILIRLIEIKRPKQPRSLGEFKKGLPDKKKEKLFGQLLKNKAERDNIDKMLELLETVSLKARSVAEEKDEMESDGQEEN